MPSQGVGTLERPEPLLLELLDEGLDVEIAVTGDSMSPFLRDRDVLTLAPNVGRRPRFGEIVAWLRPDGRLLVHRVVAISGTRCLTCGDAAAHVDDWVEFRQLVARVERLSRQGRRRRVGLGPERVVLGGLSRVGLLRPLMWPLRWLARRFDGRALDQHVEKL